MRHCPKLTGKLPKLLVPSLKVPAISKLTMVNCGKLQLKRPDSGFIALQTSLVKISNISQ